MSPGFIGPPAAAPRAGMAARSKRPSLPSVKPLPEEAGPPDEALEDHGLGLAPLPGDLGPLVGVDALGDGPVHRALAHDIGGLGSGDGEGPRPTVRRRGLVAGPEDDEGADDDGEASHQIRMGMTTAVYPSSPSGWTTAGESSSLTVSRMASVERTPRTSMR